MTFVIWNFTPMDLSVIILSYQCKEKLKVTLDAVFASTTNFEYEVVLVDNGSTDGTIEMVEQEYLPPSLRGVLLDNQVTTKQSESNNGITSPQQGSAYSGVHNDIRLTFIKNTNEGFAKGNNRGLRVSKGEYKLLLNPDTKVAPDTLQIMMDFMESRPDVGIATCKLVKGDGSLDLACRRSLPDPWMSLMRFTGLSFLFPKSKTVAKYNLTFADVDQEMEIGSCVGAFMFVSPACYEKIGLLDEQFFMYGEDIDWCKSAAEAGYKVWYYPKTITIHYKGQSSRKNSKKALYEFHNVMWKYYKKHLITKYPFFLNYLVYIGIWSRYVLQLVKNWFRAEAIVSK